MIVSGAITRSIADIFKTQISARLARLLSASPSTVIILVPSIRDIVSHHVALPQAAFEKESFGLPKVCHSVHIHFLRLTFHRKSNYSPIHVHSQSTKSSSPSPLPISYSTSEEKKSSSELKKIHHYGQAHNRLNLKTQWPA